jgi:hypothetical protein
MEKFMKSIAIVLALSLLGPASAFATTPYVKLMCRSNNHEVYVDVIGASDCSNLFHIYGGNIKDTKIEQTSCDFMPSVVYTEGAALAKTVVISMGDGTNSMHLYSIEDIKTKPGKGSFVTELELFRAKLVHSKWENGKKAVFTSDLNCTGSSFDNP